MQANILDLKRRAEVAASARRFARIGVALRLSVLAGLVVLLLAAAAEADRLLYVDHLAVYDATGRRIGSAWPTSRGV